MLSWLLITLSSQVFICCCYIKFEQIHVVMLKEDHDYKEPLVVTFVML